MQNTITARDLGGNIYKCTDCNTEECKTIFHLKQKLQENHGIENFIVFHDSYGYLDNNRLLININEVNIITYDEKEYSSNSIFINFATLGGIVNILKDKLKEHVTNIKGARIGLIGVDEMYAHLTTTDIKNLEYEKKKRNLP